MCPVALAALLCLPAASPLAQITLTHEDYPYRPGSGQLTTLYSTVSNQAAIDALIAQSGPNQTWDLTALSFNRSYSGAFTVTAGPTGEHAAEFPEATSTMAAPHLVWNGTAGGLEIAEQFTYVRFDEEGVYTLGTHIINSNMDDLEPYLDGGEQRYAFPLVYGGGWESEFQRSSWLVDETYEVDGWGTMVIPEVTTPIPALRVKISYTEYDEDWGWLFNWVCYEFRSAQPIIARICGDYFNWDEATITKLEYSVSAETGVPRVSLRLDPVYPNPVGGVARVAYALPAPADVELTVFDVLGRPVRTVVRGVRGGGTHTAEVGAEGLAAGRYVLRIVSGAEVRTRAFSVVR